MLEKLPLPSAHDGALWFHASTHHFREKHRHEELEVNLVTAGTARYLLDDRTYALTPGSMIWLFPGQNHLLLDKSPDYRMWILVFRPRLLRRICRAAGRRVLLESAPAGDFCRQLPVARARELQRAFADTHARAADVDRLNAGLACAVLDAWDAFLHADRPVVGADVHPAVKRAAELLRQAPDNDDLATLARQAGLSRTRLSELFRQQTGISLVDFRNRLRLERFAAHQASTSHTTLLASALEAGFGSYQQFYRIHRRHLGRSPRAHQNAAPSPA
ncbi:AraC family transcriptional regulator [Horticoccus luteus]|uniref:AraC family transcriptional regulator n=1 Tax=Horticoccus luteus TaxID=2862869 RepID=A0A8F9XLH7_9BACT|nr:AraC family transcriptional regulator [Horticoccus luteus]QYM79044.1 AraC family transcriptional regulator [Horticoccus luteus]